MCFVILCFSGLFICIPVWFLLNVRDRVVTSKLVGLKAETRVLMSTELLLVRPEVEALPPKPYICLNCENALPV